MAVIVANPHGYIRYQRGGPENTDLNRCMPGKRDGTAAQQFAHALLQRVIAAGDMDYLLDLHTVSRRSVQGGPTAPCLCLPKACQPPSSTRFALPPPPLPHPAPHYYAPSVSPPLPARAETNGKTPRRQALAA